MAQRTGLEPATSGVTGRHSNQLNYRCLGRLAFLPQAIKWWVMTDSNRRHSACKADALPTELITLRSVQKLHRNFSFARQNLLNKILCIASLI